jgi:hypothetical protein
MDTYELIPRLGTGLVRFGMPRETIRNILGLPTETFRKSVDDRYEADIYHQKGFQIFYAGEEPKVEFIQLSSNSDFEVFYKGVNIFKTKAIELVQFISKEAEFNKNDPNLGYTYTFPTLDLSLWRPIIPPSKKSKEGQFFRTVGIGESGYYSSEFFSKDSLL